MNDPGQAVFLSYASQDAEAAKRICDALRAAGVEVWFDQNELVGGDAWDQKIRGQIASCALFVPVISANTQARLEGYFRLEWKLAAQRTHTMADEKTFLVPVVIDDTKDAVAKVPAEFKAVQWTRLRSDQTPAGFAARIRALLDHDDQQSPAVPVEHPPAGPFKKPPLRSRWVWGLPLLIAAGFGVWTLLHSGRDPEPRNERSASEGQTLTARVRELLRKPGLVRADLDAAELLAKRATELDPSDGEAWAALSRVNTMIVNLGMERTAARRAMARDLAGRAMGLAPHSFNVRFAQADYWLRGEVAGTDRRPNTAAAQALLEELARERPADPEVQVSLAVLKPFEEKREILERVAADPELGWRALTDLGWAHYFIDEYAEADKVADRAISLQPHWGGLALKIYLALYWRGDLDLAQATLARMPPAARQEDWPVMIAYTVAYLRSDRAAMLAAVQDNPQEWLSSLQGEAPRAFFLAEARRLMGQLDAAQRDYRRALVQLEPRLAATPNDENLLALKAEALWWCDEQAEARRVFQLADGLGKDLSWRTYALFDDQEVFFSRLARAINEGVILTAASLRLHPAFQRLRGDERFEALVSRAEADPRRSPQASRSPPMPASSPAAADKSVAVLAFANLSDDKANEYFSDGISEELLNVLAKVPGLKVTARTSSFHFKGKDTSLAEIARQLGVAYVVEGSVRKQGDKVRITAQLIKAADGFHVWSDTFTRDLKDIFAVQDEIAGIVAQELKVTLAPAGRGAQAVDPAALELYLRGRQAWALRTPESLAEAERLMQQAIARQPELARAHVGLVEVWLIQAESGPLLQFGNRNSREWERFIAQLAVAAKLGPTSAEYHAAQGNLANLRWDYVEADRHFRSALALNPNYATGLQWYARFLTQQGRMDEALRLIDAAMVADPFAPRIVSNAAMLYVLAGRPQRGLELAERALALPGNTDQALLWKLEALLALGRKDELAALLRPDLPTAPPESRTVAALYLAQAGFTDEARSHYRPLEAPDLYTEIREHLVFGRRGEGAVLFDADRAYSAACEWMAYLPLFDRIRGEPRFREMLARLGLTEAHARAQAWRAAHPTRGAQ